MTDSLIRLFPDPVLRKKSAPVSVFAGALQGTLRQLESVMKSQPSGIGIAAPQIGIMLQIAVVDVRARFPEAKKIILINPVIVRASDKHLSREGCMSLPEYTAQLTRFYRIELRWQDREGRHCEGSFEGLQAVCIQHEIDHLGGFLIIDRVASLKRDLIPRLEPRSPRKFKRR